ncbi:MAG TPA: hypothetical protein VG297_17085 [Bryobacteraceae bacterium]|jgi:hypothetical protein|nr:hypothetical protein [Bryobacteraceae bacterium]
MTVDAITATLLLSVLNSAEVRKLFTTIARNRVADMAQLKAVKPETSNDLSALMDADLIGAGSTGGKYYITAKGLKVARDLEKITA